MSGLKLSTEELTHLWQAAQDQAVTGVPAPFHFARAVVELQTRHTQPEATAPAQKLTLENAPIGTKAPAIMGGAWTRTELGWKWDGGSTFPRPGGDWNGKLIAPAQDLSAAIPNWSGIADRLNELDKAIAHSTNLTPQSKPRRLLYAILHEVCSSPANALSAGDRVDADQKLIAEIISKELGCVWGDASKTAQLILKSREGLK